MFKKLFFILLQLLPVMACAQHISIGERTYNFKDTVRNRPVVTEVWYPTDDDYSKADSSYAYPFIHIPTIFYATVPKRKFPLVMISHGTGGGRKTLEWLADILVSHGFVVAAVDHYGNTYDNKIAIDFVTPWERPQDISYALTQLLKDKTIGPAIDANRIGAAGFSIGGYTVIALAGGKLDLSALENFSNTRQGIKEMTLPEFPNLKQTLDGTAVYNSFKSSPPLKDARIKAFFAICPAAGQGFPSAAQFKDITAPLYIVGAQSDSIAPVQTNAKYYHGLIKGSQLFIVAGKVGHYVFLNEGTADTKKGTGPYFKDDATVDRRKVHQQVGGIAAKFFEEMLK